MSNARQVFNKRHGVSLGNIFSPGNWLARLATRAIRRYLVGPNQRWVFEQPPPDWNPSLLGRTSLYLHVPFCRNFCP